MQKRGLILRIVPYSDSSRIIKCLVDGEGLQSFFLRLSKKQGGAGHLQTGHFIEFAISEQSKGIKAIKESRLDNALGANFLNPTSYAVWLFTLELLNKSLQEDFNIPGLSKSIDTYYSHLSHSTICNDPIIPLLMLSKAFGIFDNKSLAINAHTDALEGLNKIGLQTPTSDHTVDFAQVLNVFKNHFGIHSLESEDLL